jgi:2',3'-cyclic-nucleotide 2'-phosphodiesterase (5'-nucleotidase family)
MKVEAEAAALMKANPYRIAKERNISVDDAKMLIEKAKEKNQKQLEKTGGKAPELLNRLRASVIEEFESIVNRR